MDETSLQLRSARRSYSIIGFGFVTLIAVAFAAQLGLSYLPVIPGLKGLTESTWWNWIVAFAPMYLLAFPACCLILKCIPAQTLEQKALTKKQFWMLLPICFCLTYAGNLVGTLLSLIFSGGEAMNPLNDYAMDQSPLKILVMVILAPLLEELICRKLIIDRTVRYGEKVSVLMSGLIFGLLHQNLFQFFYAFAVGCLFAYVYIRTGRLRYTVALHGIINFLGAVIAPLILSIMPEGALTGTVTENALNDVKELLAMMLVSAYSMLQMGLAVFGLVLLILKRRSLIWKESQLPESAALKAALLNVGMILYAVICLIMMVLVLFNS